MVFLGSPHRAPDNSTIGVTAGNPNTTSTASTNGKPPQAVSRLPLFADSNGYWAKKIRGRLDYFARWDDPAGSKGIPQTKRRPPLWQRDSGSPWGNNRQAASRVCRSPRVSMSAIPFLSTSQVAERLEVPFHRLAYLLRIRQIPAPAKGPGGDFPWSDADIDRTKQAITKADRKAVAHG